MKHLIVLAATMLLFQGTAHAGQADLGTPTGVISSEAGVVFFRTNGTRFNTPTCVGSGLENRFALNAATDAGKAMIALLLTAQARGKRVFVNGTANCSLWGDTEGVNYLQVED